jgi:hypothetical protein
MTLMHERPDDVVLSFADVPAAPGYRLFHASRGAGGSEDALAGLLHSGDEPDLLPGHAMETLMGVWSTGPALDTDDASGCITRTSFWWRSGREAQEVVVDVDASVGGGRSSDRSAAPEAEGERP